MDNLSSTFSQSGNNFNLGYINGFDPREDHGNSDYDTRNRFTLGALYEPKLLEFKSNRIAHTVFGGIEFAPIFSAHSGTPFSIYDCSNIFGYSCPRIQPTAGSKYKASAVSNGNVDSYNLQPILPGSHNPYFNALATSYETSLGNINPYSTPYGTFGASGSELPSCGSSAAGGCFQDPGMDRNQFWSPAYWMLDMGVYKNFHVTERINAQFRGEFYNIVNHHNLYVVPGNADYAELEKFDPMTGYPTGGNILGIKGSPGGTASASDERRQVQLALRLQF